jgi:hypothetical protein
LDARKYTGVDTRRRLTCLKPSCQDQGATVATVEIATLNDQSLWQHLDLEQKLKWASLAQIAGQMDTALEVYKDVVKTAPEFHPGWVSFLVLFQQVG